MPQTTLYARTGESIGTVELSDELFAAPVNAAVLHQVVTAQLAGRRLGTSDTKTRGEVAGGGKKPYRQKRARDHRGLHHEPGRRPGAGDQNLHGLKGNRHALERLCPPLRLDVSIRRSGTAKDLRWK